MQKLLKKNNKSKPDPLIPCSMSFNCKKKIEVWVMAMVNLINAIFKNISVISWRYVLLVEETGIPGENHRPVASH